jgi:hypothetical protein
MRTRRFNKMSSTRNESQTPQVAKSPENQMTDLLGQMTGTLTSLYVGQHIDFLVIIFFE